MDEPTPAPVARCDADHRRRETSYAETAPVTATARQLLRIVGVDLRALDFEPVAQRAGEPTMMLPTLHSSSSSMPVAVAKAVVSLKPWATTPRCMAVAVR